MRLLILMMVIIPFFVGGCSTTMPTNHYVRVGPTFHVKKTQIKRVAIIVDVCLLKNGYDGNDYWLIRDSKTAGEYMAESAKAYLTNKGYEVVSSESPLVGGYKNREQLFKCAVEDGDQIIEMHPPLYVSDSLLNDQAYKEALIKLLPQALKAVEQKANPPSQLCCSETESKKAIDLIVQKADTQALLLLIGNGFMVPGGKSMTQGLLTGAITTAATLGRFTYSRWNVSWFDTYAAYVDAKTGEILWSNSLRLKGNGFTDKEYYIDKWPNNILYHLPYNTSAKTN